ncbi:HD domain-containing protein [Candidatus Woesebacteria bacterium]|nr:HD domain-containing protein [Candidatus Woesebacteria bacterium]
MNNQTITINVPTKRNALLKQAITRINNCIEIKTLWNVANVNAIDRRGMTDHGPVHCQIVANIGLRLLRMLIEAKIKPAIVRDFNLTNDHAELVVVLGCLLHDVGMSIERENHEELSLFLANNLLRELLEFLPVRERTIVISETLHAIYNHRTAGSPSTIEGGVVRVADALDMCKGRSRIPFEAGKISIHSLSAFAIEEVKIGKGKDTPIKIKVIMNNSAGVFLMDQHLKNKLKGSKIDTYVEVEAVVLGETDKRLIKEFSLKTK